MKASAITLQEFPRLYEEKLAHRGIYGTNEFLYLDICVDSRTGEVWKLTFNPTNQRTKFVVDTTMNFSGSIVELAESILNELLQNRQSGAV